MLGELVGPGIPGGGAFVFDWRIDADSTYLLAAGPHTCPACGRASLAFGLTGWWD
jgi:hypothetical protein